MPTSNERKMLSSNEALKELITIADGFIYINLTRFNNLVEMQYDLLVCFLLDLSIIFFFFWFHLLAFKK